MIWDAENMNKIFNKKMLSLKNKAKPRHLNQTKNITGTENETTFDLILDDKSTYEWNCLAYDQAGNSDWADENWTLYFPLPLGFFQYPTVSFYNETTEKFLFEADKAVNGTVEYGATQDYGNIKKLTSFTFAVLGDTRAQSGIGVQTDIFTNITARIIDMNPDFVFNVGDATDTRDEDTDEEDYSTARTAWKDYTNVVSNLTDHIPTFIAIGNHEEPGVPQALRRYREVVIHPLNGDGMMERWNETTYWFRYGNSLFISLNTEERNETTNYENSIVGNQRDWLNKTLNMTGFTNKFVFLHRPIKGTYRNVINHEELDQMFGYYNVTAIFAGHEHYYCRNNTQTLYIITGGGGAGLHDPNPTLCAAYNKTYHFVNITVREDTIYGNAVNMSNGAVLDTFEWTTPS